MKTVVAILGMHRSGTSALTGSFESHGLSLGNVKTSSPFNKKGNRENPDIFNFHESVLTANGGSWSNPPKEIVWNNTLVIKLKELVHSYDAYGLWGFKDPRTVFMIEKWMEVFADNMEFKLVGSYRHPLSVATSLNKRNGFPLEKGIELWFQYNSKLLELCEKYTVKLIDFDSSEEVYLQSLNKLVKNLGLDNSLIEEQFYSSDLITSDSFQNENLPDKVTDVYNRLNNYVI